MEIKISEIYKKEKGNLNKVCEELSNLITGKKIELFEYDEKSEDYDLVDYYDVKKVFIWEDEQLAISFGSDEYDICSIRGSDLIIISE